MDSFDVKKIWSSWGNEVFVKFMSRVCPKFSWLSTKNDSLGQQVSNLSVYEAAKKLGSKPSEVDELNCSTPDLSGVFHEKLSIASFQ